jgi:hypothetical protein
MQPKTYLKEQCNLIEGLVRVLLSLNADLIIMGDETISYYALWIKWS